MVIWFWIWSTKDRKKDPIFIEKNPLKSKSCFDWTVALGNFFYWKRLSATLSYRFITYIHSTSNQKKKPNNNRSIYICVYMWIQKEGAFRIERYIDVLCVYVSECVYDIHVGIQNVTSIWTTWKHIRLSTNEGFYILYDFFFCVVAKRNDSLKAIMLFLTPTTLNLLTQIHISLFFRKVLCVSSVGNNSNWTLKTLPFQSLFLTHLKSILLKIFLKLSQDVVSFYYKDIRYICWLLKLKEKQENNNNKRWNQ